MIKIAISIGDLSGVGIEIALKSHKEIAKVVEPIYCINSKMLKKAKKLLDFKALFDMNLCEVDGEFEISPRAICKDSGLYSYHSFLKAIELAKSGEVKGICTLPINKKSWNLAGIKHRGHTEVLREMFDSEAIMMLGCEKLFVAPFCEHIPFREILGSLDRERLERFLYNFYISIKKAPIGVLGLNPHAGEDGVLGDEEIIIKDAIDGANKKIKEEIFFGPLVPDSAFIESSRSRFKHFVSIYHDQGLAPLKALYFEESINVTLNLPIVRTSVDHGCAYDIAYSIDSKVNTLSYKNAIYYALELINLRSQKGLKIAL